MNHVQAVTVLEAAHPDIASFGDNKTSVPVKRNVQKDSNNNVQQITKESLNVKSQQPKIEKKIEELKEYTLLGLFTFKSTIKWYNTIPIVLIHLMFVYACFVYPFRAMLMTTVWGELRPSCSTSANQILSLLRPQTSFESYFSLKNLLRDINHGWRRCLNF